MDKKTLRAKLKAKRANLSLEYREQAAIKLCQHAIKMPEFIAAKNIAIYYPHKTEVSTLPLIDAIIKREKHCCLPIINTDDNERNLLFASYHNEMELIVNKYGILEPNMKALKPSSNDIQSTGIINNNLLDIIFMPLLGFDKFGNRLGSGCGYYDATINKLNSNPTTKNSNKLIGLAFACQQVEKIPSDPWDCQLGAIITEKGVFSLT